MPHSSPQVDLRSDTVTRPTPGMRQAMASADVGDDVFGDDPTIRALEDRVAYLLGKEAALFVPSGTMGNQICIACHTTPGDEIFVEAEAHCYVYEAGAPAALAGVQIRPLRGTRGLLTASQLREAVAPANDHFPQPRLLCLENTHNKAGGTVLPLAEMRAVASMARDLGLSVHLDGARLWNASAASGHSLGEYAAVANSVSLCFSKGLGAPVGSAIAGNTEFVRRARRRRKMLGGGMRQAGILAAAVLYAMDHHVTRLPEDHARAARLARGLADLRGVSLDPAAVETNIVIADVAPSGLTPAQVVERAAAAGVLLVAFGATQVRLVTHLDVDDAGVDHALSVLRGILDVRAAA